MEPLNIILGLIIGVLLLFIWYKTKKTQQPIYVIYPEQQQQPTKETKPQSINAEIENMKRAGGPIPINALKETNPRERKASWRTYFDDGYDSHDQPFMNGITSINTYDYKVPTSRLHNPRWEKVGYISTVDIADDTIMELFRRPISYGLDLWEYMVRDKDGVEMKLATNKYIEDKELISKIDGRESKGSWLVHLDSENKWIYF